MGFKVSYELGVEGNDKYENLNTQLPSEGHPSGLRQLTAHFQRTPHRILPTRQVGEANPWRSAVGHYITQGGFCKNGKVF